MSDELWVPADLVDRLRNLAEATRGGGDGSLASYCYDATGNVRVPSRQLLNLLDRLEHAEKVVAQASTVNAVSSAMTPFERARLRAQAFEYLSRGRALVLRASHASFLKAVEMLADWYAAPDGTPMPEFFVTEVTGIGCPELWAGEPEAWRGASKLAVLVACKSYPSGTTAEFPEDML